MISDYFAEAQQSRRIRSRPPPCHSEPFTIPEYFYRHSASEMRSLMHGRTEWPNLKDLRIMLKEYLKYRKPHSQELRDARSVMQHSMSQDEYFRLMEGENRELRRKNVMYRKFTGGQDAGSVQRMIRGTPAGGHRALSPAQHSAARTAGCGFVENLKKVGRRIRRRYFQQ